MLAEINEKVKEELPKTEVVAKAQRKQFSAAEKLRILREVDACQGSGGDRGLVEAGGDLFLLSHDLAETAGERGAGWPGAAEARTETGSTGDRDCPPEV
jgi:hypothetical protein